VGCHSHVKDAIHAQDESISRIIRICCTLNPFNIIEISVNASPLPFDWGPLFGQPGGQLWAAGRTFGNRSRRRTGGGSEWGGSGSAAGEVTGWSVFTDMTIVMLS
jgi:hypothetical protein